MMNSDISFIGAAAEIKDKICHVFSRLVSIFDSPLKIWKENLALKGYGINNGTQVTFINMSFIMFVPSLKKKPGKIRKPRTIFFLS